MRVAVVAVVALVSATADAQTLPGTGGDPIRTALVAPAFVSSELPIGLPVRGGNPEDTLLLFDGFELPWALHDNGMVGVVPPLTTDMELMPSAMDVEYGRGSSALVLTPPTGQPAVYFIEANTLGLGLHTSDEGFMSAGRYGWNRAVRASRSVDASQFADVVGRWQRRLSSRWVGASSLVFAEDGDSLFGRAPSFVRFVVSAQYTSPAWRAQLAASMLNYNRERDQWSLDTRAEFVRSAERVAGLKRLVWKLGQQTNSQRYDLDSVLWRHDVGLWTSATADLSAAIRATVGVRVDSFDGDVTTQPRANVVGDVTKHLSVAIGGGAYRRPPRQLTEVADATLHPERATHVVAAARYDDKHGLRVTGSAYYIDRTRLIVRDDTGLHNTGLGTALGVELDASLFDHGWFTRVTTALRKATRRDFQRDVDRPAPYDQPFRLDLIGGWENARVAVSARLQLASGLPYTPYTDSIYNSDTDTWEPLYVKPDSARTPFHHQLDLRAEYRFSALRHVLLDAFVDLHNAYANRDAIAYAYSYDYKQRLDITAVPIFPFVGVRAWF
jgi:hypothetical protein